jgi:hypothetical protein
MSCNCHGKTGVGSTSSEIDSNGQPIIAKPCGPCAEAAKAIASVTPPVFAGAPPAWRSVDRDLPMDLPTLLNGVPVQHGDAFYVRLGSAVMVAAVPPRNIFPAGLWEQIQSPPIDTVWQTISPSKSPYHVQISTSEKYLRVATKVNHPTVWFYVRPLDETLFEGAPRTLGAITDTQLQNDAIALLDSLQSNGCQTSNDPSVSTFQTSFNTAGAGTTLAVDGLYGSNTQSALQSVINSNSDNSALANMTAPAGCVGKAVTPTQSLDTALSTLPGGADYTWAWILGGLIVVGGTGAYVYKHYYAKGHKGHLKHRTG